MADYRDSNNQPRKSDGSRRNFQRPRRQGPSMRPEDDFNWNKVLKVILSWSAIILLVFVVMTLFKGAEASEVELTYTEYQKLLESSQIESAIIKKSELTNYDFHGTLKSTQTIQRNNKSVSFQRFTLTLPILDSAIIKEWNERGITFTIQKEDNTWISALVSALPWVLLLVVWLIITRLQY